MDCFICSDSFNLSDRLPLLLCNLGHTACSHCASPLNNCPICRKKCPTKKNVSFALRSLVEAARNGDLCPEIPSDDVELLDQIAEGGCAVVYAAEWCKLPVAVKMVSLTEKGRVKLKKEMNLLVQLNHPAVLRVYGLCSWEDRIGIVMERASSSLPSPNSFSFLTVEYAKELCQGVNYLHRKSVVHGDLKPGNVLMVDNRIRIADFGTSRNIAATTTVPKNPAMTVRYAAPEQFGNIATPLSDVYSLGVVLYELFQNKEAFEGMSMYGIVGVKQQGNHFPFDKTVPAQLANVINQCVNADPILRPKISQIIEILEGLNLPKAPSIPDQSLLLKKLEVKNQNLVNQNLVIQAKNKQLISENTGLKRENQSLIETNCQLQNEINALKIQVEDVRNLNNSPYVFFHKPCKVDDLTSESLGLNHGNVEVDRQTDMNSLMFDHNLLDKLKPRVKEVLEGMRAASVTVIRLNRKSLGGDDVRALAKALKVNSSVTSIDLQGGSIGDEGVRALAEALKVNVSVTNINLSRNSIEFEGVIALAEALKVNSSVTSVNLSGNSIKAEGAIALADALKVNSSVTSVNLSGNSIKAEGAIALADALKVNSSVTSVNLSGNSIKAEGVIALAEALKVNASVTSVNLSENSIKAVGVRALADALKVNVSVTSVNLSGISIKTEGVIALAEALKVNTSVTSVNLSGISIKTEGVIALAEALKVNTSVTIVGVTGLNRS
ncbi:hypothetical protein GEMRC1_000126 [Eukaryota sp. GEM-RC1]